jgi:hypothetical protein
MVKNLMGKEKRIKYSCDDCRWNFLCKDNIGRLCGEFTLDRIMSDTYAKRVITKLRRVFIEDWEDYMSEWRDE